jgi:hypothetical protein
MRDVQQYMSELLKVQTPQPAELKLPLTMLENVVARTCYVRRAGAQERRVRVRRSCCRVTDDRSVPCDVQIRLGSGAPLTVSGKTRSLCCGMRPRGVVEKPDAPADALFGENEEQVSIADAVLDSLLQVSATDARSG